MIEQWREDWAGSSAPGAAPTAAAPAATPFLFVQLAPWPDHDVEVIAGLRYAQLAALELPAVGMAVAADIGDPAGSYHPIHPPYKQELARRLALRAETLVKANASVPLHAPRPVSVTFDAWDASWGNYHHGIQSGVCTGGGATPPWQCGGIRVTFDQQVRLRDDFASNNGGASAHAFELWNGVLGNASAHPGTTSQGSRQLTSAACTNCAVCPCAQKLDLQGVSEDGFTVQLNTTFISGAPTTLKYGFKDYPALVLFDRVYGVPVAPFNATLSKTA